MNPQTEINPSLESARAYVEGNMVGVAKKGVLCGDGRVGRLQLPGAMRAFGADAGFLVPAIDVVESQKQALNAMGVHVSAEDYVEGYLRAIKRLRGEGAVIENHADKHHAEAIFGCGYEKNAAADINQPIYDTTHSSVIHSALVYIDTLPATKKRTTILEAEHHQELADVVIEAPEGEKVRWSVFSQNADGTEMYFVEDATRSQEALRELRPLLEEEWGLPEGILTEEAYGEAFQRFRIGTAAILAEGKPIYRFVITKAGEIVVAEELGKIPTREEIIASHKN